MSYVIVINTHFLFRTVVWTFYTPAGDVRERTLYNHMGHCTITALANRINEGPLTDTLKQILNIHKIGHVQVFILHQCVAQTPQNMLVLNKFIPASISGANVGN